VTQEITIQPPTPHSKKQELIMRGFLFPTVNEIVVVCGSKFGKSLSASACLTNAAMVKRGANWRWIAPIYRQAKIGMKYFKGILPPAPHSDFVESKMMINLPNLDSNIEFWHTQNPMDLEGAGIHGQILDEAAKMPYQAYVSSKTTTTQTRGKTMMISTPLGKNWFYKKYMECKEQMDWAIKHGREPLKLAIHAPTSANPFVSKEVLEAARKELPDRLFRQHYLAEFLDEGSVFVGFRDCTEGDELPVFGAIQQWICDKPEDIDVVIGADWAKQHDYTVFTAIDYKHPKPKVVGFMRFQSLKYTDAIVELWRFAKQFKSIGHILHDKTGVGEAIDDMLVKTGLPFSGFLFTNQSKSSLINRLMIRFERNDIIIPNWTELLKELEAFEVEVSEIGTMKYNAPAGMHDDTIMSLGLAVMAYEEYAGGFELRFVEDLPYDKNLNRILNDMMDESDDDKHLFGRGF
jgi:hypothetical protein